MQLSSNPRIARITLGLTLAVALGVSACNDAAQSAGSQLPVGSVQDRPGEPLKFIVDGNSFGNASNLRLLRTEWGRLVDVFATDPVTLLPRRYFADFLIGPDIDTDGFNYVLQRLPGTGRELLTITHTFGTPEYNQAFDALDDGLQIFIVKSLSPNELPPFTAAPRNSALRLVFDDLIAPQSINASTVQLRVGYPPQTVQGSRILGDPNYGDLVNGVFRTTRVLVDLTVSQDEATSLGLTVNSLGLPEAITPNQPNAVLKVPTQPVPGVLSGVLTNLSGSAAAFTGNGATDPSSPSLDVVRVFRSGGRTSVTADPANGFLPDSRPPRLTSSQDVSLVNVLEIGGEYLVDVVYQTAACAMLPRADDLIVLTNGIYLRVTSDGIAPVGNVASGVRLEIVDQVFPGVSVTEGIAGQYRQPWIAASDQSNRPECWVTVLPTPTGAPSTGLSTNSTFTLQFSEPINPASVSGFDSFVVRPATGTIPLQTQVVGVVSGSGDLTRFTFQPRVPLRHAAAQTETYRVSVLHGATGVLDFAGNGMALPLQDGLGNPPDFQIAAGQTPIESRSVSLRFADTDEDPPPSGPPQPEFRGQLIYDLLNSRIRPRSVTRIIGTFEPQSASAARMGGPNIGDRPPLVQPNGSIIGVSMNPLTRYGARTMTMWRYFDMNFSTVLNFDPTAGPGGTATFLNFDDSTFNLDVEGMWWSPSNAGVLVDNYPQFEMRLSHSQFLPDELMVMGVPAFPTSGLLDTFADNLLDPVNDPQKIVHPKGAGYTVNPVDQTQTLNGTILAPWPMNRNVPVSNYRLYTWRDTALTEVGGEGSNGVLLFHEMLALGFDPNAMPPGPPFPPPPPVYAAGSVPSIGLPLLMDIRCYPNTNSTQSNRPNGRCATPAPVDMYPMAFSLEQAPWFSIYSGGTVTLGGVIQNVDPDIELIAKGTNPPGGANNQPRNQAVLFGQGDFVVRVNRAHSRWFECAPGVAGAGFRFADPVIEPSVADLPAGTQVLMHFRGATGIAPGQPGQTPWVNADNLDPYGNRTPLAAQPVNDYVVSFLNNDDSWKTQMSQIDNAYFFQVRLTMVSNIESGAAPEISGMGFAFYR